MDRRSLLGLGTAVAVGLAARGGAADAVPTTDRRAGDPRDRSALAAHAANARHGAFKT